MSINVYAYSYIAPMGSFGNCGSGILPASFARKIGGKRGKNNAIKPCYVYGRELTLDCNIFYHYEFVSGLLTMLGHHGKTLPADAPFATLLCGGTEQTIHTDAAAKLAGDFAAHGTRAVAQAAAMEAQGYMWLGLYREWHLVFETAAKDGAAFLG